MTTLQHPVAMAGSATGLTGELAAFLAGGQRDLPDHVWLAARHRVLDTLAAMISGATLAPGVLAIRYGRSLGGPGEAQLVTTSTLTSAAHAALVNGMLAHADETDDFEPVTKSHPGCSVVPAAWAMAEREDAGGLLLLRAVVAGYEACCRVLLAMDPDLVRSAHRSVEGIGATFGAAAASAVVAGTDELGMCHVLSYAAQQASGVWSWVRDSDHVEKAFDFGGMGARNGVYAATMVQAGFTGVSNVFEGEHNVLDAFSAAPRPQELVKDLGKRFLITDTAVKSYTAGYPIQSALDALFHLMREHGFAAADVQRLVARLPADGASVVNNRSMPSINIQHILAVALLDGGLTFSSSHSTDRMTDPDVLEIKGRIHLSPERSMVQAEAPRQAAIEVTLRNGRTVSHHTLHPPGTRQNPLDTEGVNAKARDLIGPVLGSVKTEQLIRRVNDLDMVPSIRDFRLLLQR